MITEMSWAKGDPKRIWQCLYRAACKANVGADLLTAEEAAKRELKLVPQHRQFPRNLTLAARERVIEDVKNKPPLPPTWRELANMRESAILAYAVAEVLDAHHAAHPEDGCGP
jgi:hypothetical protein